MKQTCQRIGLVLRHYLRFSIFLRDLLLTALTLSAMGGVCSNDLINFDDNKYAQHIAVQCGLDSAGYGLGLETFEASNWHPLTWILVADGCRVVRANCRGVSSDQFVLSSDEHLAARRGAPANEPTTLGKCRGGRPVRAVHPLHVESVAWVSERKDVLSVFFGLLALLAYIRYARGPSWARLGLVCAAFAASLLAKPMLVTLPFLLLLLDYWPLQRLRKQHSAEINSNAPFCKTPLLHLLAEKLPLLLLVIGSCAMTVMAQKHGGAIKSLERFPFPDRIANALWSTACYLGQTFWPVDLGVYYPYPVEGIPWYCAWGAGLRCSPFRLRLPVCRETPLSICRLVLVFGNLDTGDRTGSGRLAGSCRSLHLLPADRSFLDAGLGTLGTDGRSATQGHRRSAAGRGACGLYLVDPNSDELLEEQHHSLETHNCRHREQPARSGQIWRSTP